jgi:hypothetical protein
MFWWALNRSLLGRHPTQMAIPKEVDVQCGCDSSKFSGLAGFNRFKFRKEYETLRRSEMWH